MSSMKRKLCQGKRGRPKKPYPGGEVDEKSPACDVLENPTSPLATRSKRPVSKSNEGLRSQQQCDSTLQIRATVDTVNTDRQPLVETDRECPPQGTEQVISKQTMAHFATFNHSFQKALTQLIDEQQEAHNVEISDLKRAHEVEVDDCKIAHDIVIFNLKHSHNSEIAKLKQKCQSLQEGLSVIQKETGVRQQNDLRHKIADQCTVEAERRKVHLKNCVAELVQATQCSVDDMTRACKKYRQQIKQMKSDIPVLTMEQLQTNSRNEKPSEKLQPKQANGDVKLNAICGSYTDGSARPSMLYEHMCSTRAAITAFQQVLSECFRTSQDKPWDQPNRPDVFFVRPNHSSHYCKSFVNRVFFEGFENESFNTIIGALKFLDPKRRQEMFFSYYLREREQKAEDDRIGDPQFEEFCDRKHDDYFIGKMFPPCKGNRLKVRPIPKLFYPEFVSSFKSAAKSVWLLHKLVFSFEPPATILKVEEGADLDPKYMKSTIVQLDDHERLASKVGFMIDPGLRLNGEVIMQCEVYLAAGPIRIPDLNDKAQIAYSRRPNLKSLSSSSGIEAENSQ